ncbi:MAG: hypothetical protein E4G98_02100, partial [Promethearchaeota archaeon]
MRSELMQLDLKTIFNGNTPLTFLVGAGISMDPPSSLVPAWKIIEAIVQYCTPEEVAQDILSGAIAKYLRYEYLLQVFRDNFDPNLKFMEYFELALNPNLIHGFLADMITKHHSVMTTNFDYLIETALQYHPAVTKDVIKNKSIRLVITEDDFEAYSDHEKNVEDGLLVLYKIHGSLRNLITEESTRDSIITTLDSIGKGKEKQEDPLAIPLFKQKLFD